MLKVLSFLFLLVLGACSTVPVDESDPLALYTDAEAEMKSDHYQIAIEKFRAIKNKFPYSKYAVDAQLKIADVYYLQESFIEAAASYETFRDLHPTHEKAPYAHYRLGKSYFNDIPGNVARDLTSAQKALDIYNDFLHKYPALPEAKEAEKDRLEIRNRLANKELSIGDFYFKRQYFAGAKPRYTKVIRIFPETEAAHLAQLKLADIDQKLQEKTN